MQSTITNRLLSLKKKYKAIEKQNKQYQIERDELNCKQLEVATEISHLKTDNYRFGIENTSMKEFIANQHSYIASILFMLWITIVSYIILYMIRMHREWSP